MKLVWNIVSLLVVVTDAASSSMDFNETQPGHPHKDVIRRQEAPPSAANEDEERGPWSLPWSLRWSMESTIWAELSKPLLDSSFPKVEISKLLEALRLDKVYIPQSIDGKSIDRERVLDLFQDPAFDHWVKECGKDEAYNSLIYKGLNTIAKLEKESGITYGSMGRVAEMIEVARRSPETEKLALELEGVQFFLWWDKAVKRSVIFYDVLHVTSTVPARPDRELNWNEAVWVRWRKFLKDFPPP